MLTLTGMVTKHFHELIHLDESDHHDLSMKQQSVTKTKKNINCKEPFLLRVLFCTRTCHVLQTNT